jgi:endonuclease/exonuclease/phosphatase family metal-dependent hydrolase
VPAVGLIVLALLVAIWQAAGADRPPASRPPAGPAWQIAFYNIQSGKGAPPLRGGGPFADNHNCTDPSQPMNAWGVGLVQSELRASLADPSTIALGLAEAWHCGSPQNVRGALGWTAHTRERNGTALVARYGFAGPDEWLQLDTSRNVNPKDTMWVVRAPVCVDAECSRSIPVYVTHWFGTGPRGRSVMQQQSEDTVRFMARDSLPHVLVGDLNAFEGPTRVCRQAPNLTALRPLRAAGYVDAWREVHGTREGYTGMVNRPGCGKPEGYPWKRIDYVWLRGFQPIAMTRFAMRPPGEAGLSDHVGIVAAFAAMK